MIKSIYVKNVLIYLIVIIVSLAISFAITFSIFKSQETQSREQDLLFFGEEVIDLYQILSPKEFQLYLDNMTYFPVDILVYNKVGLVVHSPIENKEDESFTNQTINFVLDGNVYRNSDSSHYKSGIGLPFKVNNIEYAMFIKPKVKVSQVKDILLTALSIALVLGILLIMLATRILVRPVVHMTNATRGLARGNFNVSMNIKSRDELGELASSFNYMVNELNKMEQVRKDFVANVSHELQTPLTAIKGMVSALQDKLVDTKEEDLYLHLIKQESERLSGLTKELLNLASLEANKHPFHPQIYRLDQQLRNQLAGMQSLWLDKKLEIEMDIPKMNIYADENLLGQVWNNLFSNAIKYNWMKGTIIIKTHEHDDDIEIIIKNTGQGIPEEDVPFIFERFYMVEEAHHHSKNSYGIGLAVVKRIILLHNGTISVESIEEKETTFIIRLPKRCKTEDERGV